MKHADQERAHQDEYEGVLVRFPRIDEVQFHIILICPGIQSLARELRPVVRHDDIGLTPFLYQAVKYLNYSGTRQRSIYFDRKTLPGEVIYDIQHSEPAPGVHLIGHIIHRPAVIWCRWFW